MSQPWEEDSRQVRGKSICKKIKSNIKTGAFGLVLVFCVYAAVLKHSINSSKPV